MAEVLAQIIVFSETMKLLHKLALISKTCPNTKEKQRLKNRKIATYETNKQNITRHPPEQNDYETWWSIYDQNMADDSEGEP